MSLTLAVKAKGPENLYPRFVTHFATEIFSLPQENRFVCETALLSPKAQANQIRAPGNKSLAHRNAYRFLQGFRKLQRTF